MSVTKKYDENLYIISDGDDLFVRAFLITGEDKNLLIDTGYLLMVFLTRLGR